jgi:hypothetical protein
MKMNLNQVRTVQAVKITLCAGLLVLSTGGVMVPRIPASQAPAPKAPAPEPVVITVRAGATGAEIQQVLDGLPADGGEVVLPAGTFAVSQPIVLRRDLQTLRGSGAATILRLADGANCPVIILGEPINNPRHTVKNLRVSSLFIDGNRQRQQRERWQTFGEGSEIRNNGITVQNVSNSVVEHVTCARCRSGGLVTTRGVRWLTVRDLTAFDNEFDGLACYQTTDCLFTKLQLHDNPGAGISLDLAFNHNVISNAVLTANNLGIFMRTSCHNQFHDISIFNSRHYGVFMADVEKLTTRGRQSAPRSGCVDNFFTDLIASDCGAAAFRVNDPTCTNNVVVRARFDGNPRGVFSLVQPDLLKVR